MGLNNASGTFSGTIYGIGVGVGNTGNLNTAPVALLKVGTGTQLLTGTNSTYSGGTTINGGILGIAADGSLGSTGTNPTTTLNFSGNSTLQAEAAGIVLSSSRLVTINPSVTATIDTNTNNMTIAGNISGASAAGLTKVGNGTLTLSGSNTYHGVTSINAGVVSLGSSAALGPGNITFGGGAMQFTSNNNVDYSSQIVNSTGPINIDTNGQTVTFASSLGSSNTGGLYLTDTQGDGTLILSANNGYLGTTEVENGILEAQASDAIPYGSGLTVGANGTVEISDPPGAGPSVVVTSSFAAPHAGGVAAVPEPGTLALLAAAALLAAVAWRRRKGS